MFAYAPLFIQGVQGKTPMQVGVAMLSLSLGWSVGSLALGQVIDRIGHRAAALVGAVCLVAGCAMALTFEAQTTPPGIVLPVFSLSESVWASWPWQPCWWCNPPYRPTIWGCDLVQSICPNAGGTVGVGIGGSFIAARFSTLTRAIQEGGLLADLPPRLQGMGGDQVEGVLQPEVLAALPEPLRVGIQEAVRQGVGEVFWTVLGAAVLCLLFCWAIPRRNSSAVHR